MKSAVETLSPTRVRLTVEVPFDELADSVESAYKKIASQVTIPGFRKGKVPTRIIDQRVGRGAVLEEAINGHLPKAYAAAVNESGVRPIGRPEVEVTGLEDGQQFSFTAEVDVRPEFDLPDFASITLSVDDAAVTEDDIDVQLTGLRSRFASLTTVDRPAADGDVLLVDISGVDEEGKPVEDLTGTAMSYELGTGGMLPGFDEAVAGAAAGETRTFEFTPPAGEWEGRPLTVSVEVKEVRERVLPEADDEFAGLASEFDTLAELRADLATRLGALKRAEQIAQARGKMLEHLVENLDIPLPQSILDAEAAEHFADGHGDDDHRAEFADQARKQLKSQLILDALAEREEIGVDEQELSQWLVQQAPRYGMSPDQLAQALVESEQVDVAFVDIRRAKALTVATRSAKVFDASGNPIDLDSVAFTGEPA